MVEFALVGPLFFLLILGIIIVAIVVKNQIALSNVTRDAARAAAVCGSATSAGTSTLPDGTTCSAANLDTYVSNGLRGVDPSLAGQETFKVCNTAKTTCYTSTGSGSAVANCQTGVTTSWTVEVSVTYTQPLYVPLIGYLIGNGTTNTRSISAAGEASCEQ